MRLGLWHAQRLPHGWDAPTPRTLIEELQLGDETLRETRYGFDDRKVGIIGHSMPLHLIRLLQAFLHRRLGCSCCVLHVLNQYERIVFKLKIERRRAIVIEKRSVSTATAATAYQQLGSLCISLTLMMQWKPA